MDPDCEELPGFPGINVAGSIPGQWLRPVPGADRVLVVSGFAEIAAAGTGVVQRVTWQYPGLVVACLGCASGVGSDAGLASLAVRITIGDGQEEVITTGEAAGFVELMNLHGRSHQPFN